MDIKEKLYSLSERCEILIDQIKTEEATKQSLLLPFFQILGYDVFNPLEFCPEFDADYGIKKGEKVDYAIIIDGEPIILVEAKNCCENLDKHGAQLFRYFNSSKAKFGILTNGIKYWFYTDLDELNKMDQTPFFEVDLLNLTDAQIAYLDKFQRDSLDVNSILSSAEELKYTNLIKEFFKQQLNNTSEDFTNYILAQVYEGRKTANVLEKFQPIVKKSFNQFINETLSTKFAETLNGRKVAESETVATAEIGEEETSLEHKIITTQEELEAFAIIKTLLHDTIPPEDITYKDTETYFGILYKENTRKWICRLYLGSKKSVVLPGENKTQDRVYIESINGLYDLKEKLQAIASQILEC